MTMSIEALREFVRESNLIEGIHRDPTEDEVWAHRRLLAADRVTATILGDLQSVVAPDKPLRERDGMNVRVGEYIAPPGGPSIVKRLQALCRKANEDGANPYAIHVAFEKLHPYIDGNGRTGRALWAWLMLWRAHEDPFALPFLHRFYYQTLAAA